MIQQAIDEYLALEQEKRKDRVRSGKWNFSSLGRCYRNQFWNRKNENPSNPTDARGLRVFAVGHLFHDFVEKIIEFKGTANKEVPVEDKDLQVFGYADLVTHDEVIDIKSVHSRKFHYLDSKTIGVKEKPNVLQVLTYAKVLGRPKGRLVYVSKDDLCIFEIVFQLDEYWNDEIKKEFTLLNNYWKNDILPPPEPRCYMDKTGKSKECTYCSFLDRCREEQAKTPINE